MRAGRSVARPGHGDRPEHGGRRVRRPIARPSRRAVAHTLAAGDVRGRLAPDAIALELDFSQGRLTAMIDAGLRLADEALAIGDRARAAATWARLVSTAGWAGRGDLAEELAGGARAGR